jgi:predicted NBD/HSP70 family sugar kinase
MKVVHLGKRLAKQDEDEYISEYVSMRELGLKPGQLGRILGFLDWQRKTFPAVLERLKEAEEHLDRMRSDDPQADAKARIAVWHARVVIQTLVNTLNEYLPE